MSLDFGNSDDLEVFDYDVQSPPSELPSELFEDEMDSICTRTRDRCAPAPALAPRNTLRPRAGSFSPPRAGRASVEYRRTGDGADVSSGVTGVSRQMFTVTTSWRIRMLRDHKNEPVSKVISYSKMKLMSVNCVHILRTYVWLGTGVFLMPK